MHVILSRNWWVFLVRGFAALLLGLSVFVSRATTLTGLATLLAAYFVLDGIFALIFALLYRPQSRWWAVLLEGFVGVLAGITALVLSSRDVTFNLLYVVAFWAMVSGLAKLVFGLEIRKTVSDGLWIVLASAVSIFFGILAVLVSNTVVTLVGAFGLLSGVIVMIFAFLLRMHSRRPQVVAARRL
jgi:uncharacterized membrane protein HdeD (DUF308 family)